MSHDFFKLPKAYQEYIYECGCTFVTGDKKRSLISIKGLRQQRTGCKEHHCITVVKHLLHCRCGNVETMTGAFNSAQKICKICQAEAEKICNKSYTQRELVENRTFKKLIFSCGCTAPHSYKTKTCPDHDEPIVAMQIRCIKCHDFLEVPPGSNSKIYCEKCRLERNFASKLKKKETRTYKDRLAGSKHAQKAALKEIERKIDCKFYRYCLIKQDIFEDNPRACEACPRYAYTDVREEHLTNICNVSFSEMFAA
jgi:hypothetical protein